MVDHYFKFSFTSAKSGRRNMVFSVYAETIEDLKLFLIQHRFTDADPHSVEIIPVTKCKNVSNERLSIHKFKSNKSDEIYSVMTSDFFANTAIDDAADELNYTMLFGEAMLRRDIEIFKSVGDILFELPHAHIADFVFADTESTEVYPQSIKEIVDMRKSYLDNVKCAPCEDGCAYLVHESLHDAVLEGEVYPVTIERYVSTFTSLIMDEYN